MSLIVRIDHLPDGVRFFISQVEASAGNMEYTVFVSDSIAEDLKADAVSAALKILRERYHVLEQPIFVETFDSTTA